MSIILERVCGKLLLLKQHMPCYMNYMKGSMYNVVYAAYSSTKLFIVFWVVCTNLLIWIMVVHTKFFILLMILHTKLFILLQLVCIKSFVLLRVLCAKLLIKRA